MKYIYCFILIFYSFISNAQVQIGNDIDGEAAFDRSGESVSISSDGSVLAIGASFNDDNGENSGHVRVYENLNGTWTQIGNDIDGEVEDFSGRTVALSADGSIVAIGSPGNNGNSSDEGTVRIYENQNGIWTQLGQNIDGESIANASGWSLDLSEDGTIVAIGSIFNSDNGTNAGHVRIFQYNNSSWEQVGQDIDGESPEDRSGNSLSISNNGNIIAIGASRNNGNGNLSGHVRIYENINGNWQQIGTDINGVNTNDLAGTFVSISSDGSIVAIASIGNDSNGADSGHVRVFSNDAGNWVQIGNAILGEDPDDRIGRLSISGDGTVLVISSILNDDAGDDAGEAKIYQFINGNWEQIGVDISGEDEDNFLGTSVSMSTDGMTVAIGANRNDGNGTRAGHVRVFDLNSIVLATSDVLFKEMSIYPNPVSDILNIELPALINLDEIKLYNSLGQHLGSFKQSQIDVSKLSSGIYYINIITKGGEITKKILVQ